MTLSRTYRYFAVLVTALVLLLQGASLSHAATFGPDSHDHEGVQCVLSLGNELQAVVPAPQASIIIPALTQAPAQDFETDFFSALPRQYRGREPPPRGPPSNQT